MNKKSALILLTLTTIGLSACVTAEPIYRNPLPKSTATAKEINLAKQEVRDLMKDPSSVQFKNVAGYSIGPSRLTSLCGQINAKNGYGAYNGFRHFTYLAGILNTNELEGKPAPWENVFNADWNRSCKKH